MERFFFAICDPGIAGILRKACRHKRVSSKIFERNLRDRRHRRRLIRPSRVPFQLLQWGRGFWQVRRLQVPFSYNSMLYLTLVKDTWTLRNCWLDLRLSVAILPWTCRHFSPHSTASSACPSFFIIIIVVVIIIIISLLLQ